MAVFKPQRKTSSGMEDLDIDASTLDGKDSSHYLNYNNLTNKPTVPTKTSQLTNDSGFKTTDTDTWRTISVNGATIFGGATNTAGMNLQAGSNVTIKATAGSPNVKISATNTTYTFDGGTNGFTVTPEGGTAQTVTVTPSIANATTSKAGLMSSTDKTNLNTLSNLLGTDSDAVVNKINEVIEIFDSYPEGNKIVDALAGKQSKVAALGSTTKPVYVSAAGTFAAASTYAGGTKVTLNGTDKGASTATIYAPTVVGTSGQILKSNGSGAPTWVAQSDLTVGHASSAGSATAATTAQYATNDQLGNNIKDTYAKKEYAVYYVAGNTTGTAGNWTGTNSDIKSLYDGLVINYKIGINGADPTTLNINGLGAKTVYLRGTTKVTTHYDVGTMVLLAYNATKGAFYSADYDANSYAYVRQYKTTTHANYPILFSYDTTLPSSYDTKYTRKNSNITANPNTGTINATSFVENGKTLSSKYLPSSGGNINGNLSVGGNLVMNGGGNISGDSASFHTMNVATKLNLSGTKKITYDDTYEYTFPDKSGTVALLSDIPSGGGGTSSFIRIEDYVFSLESQRPMDIGLDGDLRNELFVYISTQDGAYELSDDFGNTVSCKEVAVMHLNYMSEDEMLLGTMTSDTGVSKPFISSNLVFFAESGDSITLNVIIYGR